MAELSTLGSVIKTAYEAEADTNAYTDAEKSKLTAIEAAADVTDTANVTAAGALMDSEVTNLAAVKAFDPTDYATAAQGTAADAAKAKTDYLTVTQPVDLDTIESRVNELDAAVVLKGEWDASAGTFPGAGAAQAGWSYIVSVGGTVDGQVFVANDRIVAITDNASTATYAANWLKLDYTDAVLSVAGQTGAISAANLRTAINVEDGAQANAALASQAEAEAGTENTKTMTAFRVAQAIAALAGGAGDFKADGTVDMTGEFKTDVGTFASDVANGASAVGFDFNTTATFNTSGALLFRLRNNGTNTFGFSFEGGISHLNSGASTAAHAQSYNFNLTASGTQTSSGQYSVVMGRNNTASATGAVAIGQTCTASGVNTVAMGVNSSASQGIAIGNGCTASGNMAVAMGHTNTASGPYSAIFGFQGSMSNRTAIGIGAGRFAADGDAQGVTIMAKAATTDATQTTLSNAGTNVSIPADTTWAFSALVVGRSDESDGNDSAAYRIEGCLSRDESNNTALVGSITKTVIAESAGATAWDVTAEADDTNEALAIKVTGEAGTNIRWVAKIEVSQVTFA